MSMSTPVMPPAMPATTPRLPTTVKPGATLDMDAARKTAREFEAVFVGQMVSLMFQGLETPSVFGGGEGEKMYRSMMQDEYGRAIARSGGLGIADSVMKTMIQMQEKAR